MLVEQRAAHLLLERTHVRIAPAERGVVRRIEERRRVEWQGGAGRSRRAWQAIGERARRIVAAGAGMATSARKARVNEQPCAELDLARTHRIVLRHARHG